jgi:hypothetical protein
MAKRIVKLYSPFFSVKFPNFKSDLALCDVSDQFFIEQLEENTRKCLFISVESNLNFISLLSIRHLFL